MDRDIDGVEGGEGSEVKWGEGGFTPLPPIPSCCLAMHDLSLNSLRPASLWLQVMKFAKDSRHECSINVLQIKGVTRAVTGGWHQQGCK
jgi:hypothetical protein